MKPFASMNPMTMTKAPRHLALGIALLSLTASAQAAEPGSAGSLFQVVPGLALVLGLIAACAWVAKRIGPGRVGGHQAIKFIASQSLGSRDRVVIVEVNQQWLVLGVSPGRVNTLSQMARPDSAFTASSTTESSIAGNGDAAQAHLKPPFAAWLEKALNKK